MADVGNVSGVQGASESEWTNQNTAGQNNSSRIELLAIGHSKYKGGVAPPCVNLKVVQPTLRRRALGKGAFVFPIHHTVHFFTFKHRDTYRHRTHQQGMKPSSERHKVFIAYWIK